MPKSAIARPTWWRSRLASLTCSRRSRPARGLGAARGAGSAMGRIEGMPYFSVCFRLSWRREPANGPGGTRSHRRAPGPVAPGTPPARRRERADARRRSGRRTPGQAHEAPQAATQGPDRAAGECADPRRTGLIRPQWNGRSVVRVASGARLRLGFLAGGFWADLLDRVPQFAAEDDLGVARPRGEALVEHQLGSLVGPHQPELLEFLDETAEQRLVEELRRGRRVQQAQALRRQVAQALQLAGAERARAV